MKKLFIFLVIFAFAISLDSTAQRKKKREKITDEGSSGNEDCGNLLWDCDALWQEYFSGTCSKQVCYDFIIYKECNTFNGLIRSCVDGPDFVCTAGCSI